MFCSPEPDTNSETKQLNSRLTEEADSEEDPGSESPGQDRGVAIGDPLYHPETPTVPIALVLIVNLRISRVS